ncbi:unnamed protein product, partial [Brenthis ino]
MDFSDKVVLITGASGGIGAICAVDFAKLHAKLSLVGRNEDKLNNVVDQCEKASGIKPLAVIADISKAEDISRIIKDTINQYGKLDVLVNNAGMLIMAGVLDDISNYDRISATNVRGPYMLTQQAVPHLIKTKGNIVNVSSVLSTVTIPAMAPYCISKAALDMFTKCMALELASKGVRVNSVNPGPVTTDLFKSAGVPEHLIKDLYASTGSKLPLKKVAQSEDVSKMILFLASDSCANCITGSFHIIDCGLHLGQPVLM